MLLGRRVPYRGRSGMVYFGFVNDSAHLLGISRNPSINIGIAILFLIFSFGISTSCAPIYKYGFSRVPKISFFGLGKGGRRTDK